MIIWIFQEEKTGKHITKKVKKGKDYEVVEIEIESK
jgi:hypothetical protein